MRGRYAKEEDLWAQFESALDSIQITVDMAQGIANELNKTHKRLTREREKAVARFNTQLPELESRQDDVVEMCT